MEFSNASINKRQQSIKRFSLKYQEVLLFNKSIIIAAIASIIADAVVVHYSAAALSNGIVISLISIIYLAAFACLFYIDNRKKYFDIVTGKRDSVRLKQDARKILTALGVSEVVYVISKFVSIYSLLQANAAPPYQGAMLTTLVAWVFYIITANLMIRAQKLF